MSFNIKVESLWADSLTKSVDDIKALGRPCFAVALPDEAFSGGSMQPAHARNACFRFLHDLAQEADLELLPFAWEANPQGNPRLILSAENGASSDWAGIDLRAAIESELCAAVLKKHGVSVSEEINFKGPRFQRAYGFAGANL